MAKPQEIEEIEEKVILVGVSEQEGDDAEDSVTELAELVKTAGATVVGALIQKRETIHPGTYVGTGKVEEIAQLIAQTGATGIVCDDELSPAQLRNLESMLDTKVMDRTLIILDIFAARATTSEGKIQVELAQLKYRLSRLSGLGKTMSRLGGGIGTRGPGEKKLEIDRRLINDRIAQLNRELKEVVKHREITRAKRAKSEVPVVAIVGYTNAGKSTTMNGLLRACGKDDDKQVFEKDMLFATLDTSVRRLHFKDNKDFLISDTVGFVSHLPHQLVQAFKSTLSEAAKADLLVQVIDVSDPNYRDMIKTTEETLKEIGVENIPMIYAFNKADLTEAPYPEILGNQITYSAKDPASIEKIVELIKENIFKDDRIVTFKIPFSEGRYLDELNVRGTVLETTYEEDGTVVSANVSPELHSRLSRFETH